MTYLLDTHIFLWWLSDDRRLSQEARTVLADGANIVYLSAVSIAEIAIKKSLGKLSMPVSVAEMLTLSDFTALPFEAADAALLEGLPWHHRDPFDRMLIAQAGRQGLTFITADTRCRAYDVAIL